MTSRPLRTSSATSGCATAAASVSCASRAIASVTLDAGVAGEHVCPSQQRRLQIAALRGEAAQLRAGRLRLGATQRVGQLEQLLHHVALVAPQQVDQPRALGRSAQLSQGAR